MKADTLRKLRQWHLYLGMFFAPMLLLFAVSGALQVFRLNEERGYGGTPPSWMVWFASIHKNQAPPREKKAEPAGVKAPKAAAAKSPDAAKRGNTLPLKILALLMAASLALSTLLGILIALNSRGSRTIAVILLIAGAVLPIMLLKL